MGLFSSVAKVGTWFDASRLLALLILAGFIGLRIADPPILQTFRLQVFDMYQRLKPRERTPQPVGVIDIDEASLNAYGQWPWPRTLIADLVAKTYQSGGMVAFDMVFAEPDRMSPALFAETVPGITEDVRAKLDALPSNDAILATTFQQSLVISGESGSPRKVEQSAHSEKPKQLPVAVRGTSANSLDPARMLPKFDGLIRNLPELEQSANGNGVFTILPERDGIIRRVPSVVIAEDVYRLSLGLEMFRIATGGKAVLLKTDDAGVAAVVVGGIEVPTDQIGRIWVHFTEFGSRPPYISAKDILDGKAGPNQLQGRLLLIGTSATGLLDIKTTPLDPAMPGVEVHAQLLETILSKSHLFRPNYATGAEIALMFVMGLFLTILLPFAGAVGSLLTGAVLSAGVVGTSWYLYTTQGMLLDVVYPLFATALMFLAMVFFNYYREERQRQQIRGAFQQYLSPDLVEQLAEHPEHLQLGGEERTMTIMFSDVRGFTTISESFKDDPQGLTRLMNRFLTPLTNAIIEQRGTIDKYMGDAIMAFWNAPLDDTDHCLRSCRAALDMLDRIDQVNSERKAEAEAAGQEFLPLNVGIGINTGQCVVGNMGSDIRFDYSVLGDSVNLASRLEGQSKNYGVKIIVGESTCNAVSDEYAAMELDLIRVKGKFEPERIFVLLGDKEVLARESFKKLHACNEDMLTAFRDRRWGDAQTAIDQCKEYSAQYGLEDFYAMYELRLLNLETNPPSEHWDGVFVATTK